MEHPALDNIWAPECVLADAQRLSADTITFGGPAEWDAHLLINEFTSGVQTATLGTSTAETGEDLRRNSHQSAMQALFLSGAAPACVDPVRDEDHELLNVLREKYLEATLQRRGRHVSAVVIVSSTLQRVFSDISCFISVTVVGLHTAPSRAWHVYCVAISAIFSPSVVFSTTRGVFL